MPALLPYLPAMMLPLVRLDESSHSSAAPDASMPAHLAEVSIQVALIVPDLLMQDRGVCDSSVILTSDPEGVFPTGSGRNVQSQEGVWLSSIWWVLIEDAVPLRRLMCWAER